MTDTKETTPVSPWAGLMAWLTAIPQKMPSWSSIAKYAVVTALGLAIVGGGWYGRDWFFGASDPGKAKVALSTNDVQSEIDLAALVASVNRLEATSATSEDMASLTLSIKRLTESLGGLARDSDVAELTAEVKQLGINLSMAADAKIKPPSPVETGAINAPPRKRPIRSR